MATSEDIVVTLDGLVVDPSLPIVWAEDPTFLRGDGVFETLLLRDGKPCLVEAHLARLARSATIIGLPVPDHARWREALAVAAARWTGTGDAVLRLVLGRGRGLAPTAFVTVSALPVRVMDTRRDGVSAMTLQRGRSAPAGAAWSIATVKSLSYAGNAAALREAIRCGVDEVILIDSDGWVLEGPRSSVVVIDADGTLTTPPETSPILAGTTVRAIFDTAATRGVACRRRPLRVTDLLVAQGVWLVSSVTLAARVHTLNGAELPGAHATFGMAALVDEAVAVDG